MVSIQPVIPQTPPPGAQGPQEQSQKEQSQFSPHLENAISSKTSPQQGADDRHLEKTSRSNDLNDSTDKKSPSQEATGAEAIEKEKNPAATGLAYFLEGTSRTIPATSIFFHSQQVASRASRLQNASAVIDHRADNSRTPPGLAAIQAGLSSMTTEESEVLSFIKPGVANKQDALLKQLQQIIDSANETGSVSLTKVADISSPHGLRNTIHGLSTALFVVTAEPVTASPTRETDDLTLSSLLFADGIEKTAGKPTQNWTGTRHDMQQHYFNARNTAQNPAENKQSFQDNQQGEEFSRHTLSSSPQSVTLAATEPANTFSQVAATVPPGTAPPASEAPKPILFPPGAIVHEEEVIRQLSERFQISSRHMDSRINIKLHPAELGELKIDLTVKEGCIRAHVVAQSQHTLEILEKNIQKLKTMLEQQGFSIEQISLAAESESVGDFDLFDRQLFGKNDSPRTTAKGHREVQATFPLEDQEIAATASNTGVNVKI